VHFVEARRIQQNSE